MNNQGIRFTSIALALSALSACMSGVPVTEGPDATARAIGASEIMSLYFVKNAGETSVPLLKNGRGFVLNNDGTMTYDSFGSRGEKLWTSNVTREDGNVICMDRVDVWSGACLTLFQNFDGTIRVIYRFGNGHGGNFDTNALNI